jgi:RNA polymerase sigma factor (sigma-70 family)
MADWTDAELVTRAQAGDRAAFAGIYDRYSAPIYDLCTHMLRNPDDAADATAEVFLAAAEHIEQLVDPAKLKSWLYAIARNEVYRRSRQRSREIAIDTVGIERVDHAVDGVEGDPEMTTEERDLTIALPAMSAGLVRDAALGLAERDRLVLEMTLAGGLDGRALGDALGVSVDGAHQAAHRMRERLARSVGALLVARKGQADCPGLQTVLTDWDGTFSVLWRKRVARHADKCAICGARRQSIPQKVLSGTFGAIPFTFLIPPDGLREQVLNAAGLHAEHPDLPRPTRWRRRDGFPHPVDQSRRRVIAAVGVTLAVIALGLGGVAVTANNDPGPSVAIQSPSSSSSTSSTKPNGSTAREVPSTDPTAPAADGGQLAPPGTTKVAPTLPTQTAPPPPPPPPPADTAPPTLKATIPAYFPLGVCGTGADVTADALDPSGITQVTMTFSGPTSGSLSLGPTGGTGWRVHWLPLASGHYTVVVTARDGAGNQRSTGGVTDAGCIT